MHGDTAIWREDARYFEFEGHQIAYWLGKCGKPLLLIHGYPNATWDWRGAWETSGTHACDY